MQIHARLIIFRLAILANPVERNLCGHIKIKRQIRLDSKAIHVSDPLFINVSRHIARKGRINITVGKDGTVKEDSKDGYTFTVDCDFAKFARLEVNGIELVKDTDYTVKSGSTIITITKAGLAKIGEGTHTVKVFFTDGGVALMTLTVAPKGGLSTGALVGIIIGCVALAGIAGFCVYWFAVRKKKKA